MNLTIRWCIAFAICALHTAAHAAGLQTYWSQRYTNDAASFNAQVTRFDPDGNLIVGGTITDATTGQDILVVKLAKMTGVQLWSFRKNGLMNGTDKLGNLVVSNNGDVHLAGALQNEASNGASSGSDAYGARLNGATGQPVWEFPNGNNITGDDAFHDLALDDATNPVFTGVVPNGGLGSEVWTVKLSRSNGAIIWQRSFHAFETQLDEQGERVFVGSGGDVYVQGSHGPVTYQSVNYPPTVVVVSYAADGTFRFGTRFFEGQNARAYGFLPAAPEGFLIGVSRIQPPENAITHSMAKGKSDGTQEALTPLPGVEAQPWMGLAENGDILIAGRGGLSGGIVPMVGGRLSQGNLGTFWVRAIANAGGAPGTGFAHVDYGQNNGSALAGIAPGTEGMDLQIATFAQDGTIDEVVLVDNSVSTAPGDDMFPAGPALVGSKLYGLGVAIPSLGPAGEREMLARRLRVLNAPTITLTNPNPSAPVVPVGEQVSLSAIAYDEDADDLEVEFFVNGVSLGTTVEFPHEMVHTFPTAGTYTVEAVVTDATGQTGTTGVLSVLAGNSPPIVMTGTAVRTGPSSGTLSGTVANLPFPGTARFRFNFSGQLGTADLFTGDAVAPAGPGPHAITIPFFFPEPHRSYDYVLEVVASDEVSTISSNGATQSWTVPNAPVAAQPDFAFAPRGVIRGKPQANDQDHDNGETLTVSIDAPSLPGTLTAQPGGFAFTPAKTFTGEVVVPYTVDDGHGSTSTGSIVIRNALFYAGSYRALAPPESLHLGGVDVTVAKNGRATVIFYVDGVRYRTAGELAQLDDYTIGFSARIRRPRADALVLFLRWGMDRQLSGTVVEDDGSGYLDDVVYAFDGLRGAAVSQFPAAKLYSLLGTHVSASGGSTDGRVTAFAHLAVPTTGKAILRGKLGDGSSFVTTAQVQSDGRLAIYTPVQGRPRSFLIGRMELNDGTAAAALPGLVAVQDAGTRTTPPFAKNYRDEIAFSGLLYTPASPGNSPLAFTAEPRRLTVGSTSGGFAATNFDLPIWLGRRGEVNGIIGITRVSINGQTGEFSGAFLPPGRRTTLPFSGVLRPGLNSGIGVFRGSTAAGVISITPH